MQNAAPNRDGVSIRSIADDSPPAGLEAKTSVFVLKLGHTATGVHKTGGATVPCRVHGWVDVECHRVTLFAPSGFHLNDRTICHFDVDDMVVWMRIFFHDGNPYADAPLGAL